MLTPKNNVTRKRKCPFFCPTFIVFFFFKALKAALNNEYRPTSTKTEENIS